MDTASHRIISRLEGYRTGRICGMQGVRHITSSNLPGRILADRFCCVAHVRLTAHASALKTRTGSGQPRAARADETVLAGSRLPCGGSLSCLEGGQGVGERQDNSRRCRSPLCRHSVGCGRCKAPPSLYRGPLIQTPAKAERTPGSEWRQLQGVQARASRWPLPRMRYRYVIL
jgi:hypothetical protein